MKKKVILSIILIILIICIVCLDKVILDKKDELKYDKVIELNVGDKIVYGINDYPSAIIKWDNLEDEDGKIYYTGEYNGTVTYKNKNYPIKMIVKDMEAPLIDGVTDIEVIVNSDIDLLKDINVTDNSNDDIKKEIVGNYDLNKTGIYNLEVKATDKSGNTILKKFKLTVKEKNKKVNSKVSSKGYKIEEISGITYVNGILIANKTYGLPETYNPGGLLKDFTDNFELMRKDALKDGIELKVVSGFRSYNIQNGLYNRYVNRDGKALADTYSARPGYSEHQTGLAADLNSVSDTFGETKEGIWLANNCYKYGFILRYPKGKESYTGYMYESWHFRYVGDIARDLYNNGSWISLEEYLGITSKYK